MFNAIYEMKSISHAAKHLDLSQPGMSHTLARLRKQMDDQLFVRKGNGVEPTVRAESIAQPIRLAIEQLTKSFAPVEEFDPKTSKRHFRLMLADFVEPIVMPNIFSQTSKNLDITFELISIQSMKMEDAILGGLVDLVILVQPPQMYEVSWQVLFQTDIVAICRRDHPITRELNNLVAFLEYGFINLNLRAGVNLNFDKVQSAERTENVNTCLIHSLRSIPPLVAKSDLIGFVPRIYANEIADLYNLHVMESPTPMASQDMGMMWHRSLDNDIPHQWLRTEIKRTFDKIESQSNER